MAADFEQRVIELVTEVTDRSAVGLHDRLLDDLGIDGDDAVALFELFATRFGTDLSALYAQWRLHFGPEGLSLSAGLGMVVAALVPVAPSIMLGAPKWVAIGAGLVTAAFWMFWLRCWPLDRRAHRAIHVSDLVDAARAGHWTLVYDDPAPHGQAAP